jgi:hypothetical protein
LDTRLSRLDKTIAPFGIQDLTREASSESQRASCRTSAKTVSFVFADIDIALAVLSGENVRTEIIKSDFAVGKHEETIISRVYVYDRCMSDCVFADQTDLVARHGSPSYSEFDEYTAAINRILKEIDRLARNELRSSEVHIRDFVSTQSDLS